MLDVPKSKEWQIRQVYIYIILYTQNFSSIRATLRTWCHAHIKNWDLRVRHRGTWYKPFCRFSSAFSYSVQSLSNINYDRNTSPIQMKFLRFNIYFHVTLALQQQHTENHKSCIMGFKGQSIRWKKTLVIYVYVPCNKNQIEIGGNLQPEKWI